MTVSASTLRQDIYKLLDHVLETGIPLEIQRNKGRLRIVPVKKRSKLSNLKNRSTMKCNPEDFVHIDWSKEWRP